MKKIICIALALLIAIGCTACSGVEKKERYKQSFLDAFDTASTVIAYDTSDEEFKAHFDAFHEELLRYDHLYDIYNQYEGITNLYVVNKTAKDGPVKVDKDIIELLDYCKTVYEMSKGQTNACFGAVLSLWHTSREYGMENPESAYLPEMDKLKAANEHTSIDDLVIDKENSTVYFADPELRLDVGAIAKGYAVSKVTEFAQRELWSSAAISIGGNIATFGYKNDDGKTLWNIGIENPDKTADDYLLNVGITDLSVVTSGDYQRYYMVDGKKYCHIINTESLMPSEYFSGVSVICSDSALGDALSTTLFNLPLEEGMELVESMDGVEAVWVDTQYNKTFSSGFEQYVIND